MHLFSLLQFEKNESTVCTNNGNKLFGSNQLKYTCIRGKR